MAALVQTARATSFGAADKVVGFGSIHIDKAGVDADEGTATFLTFLSGVAGSGAVLAFVLVLSGSAASGSAIRILLATLQSGATVGSSWAAKGGTGTAGELFNAYSW